MCILLPVINFLAFFIHCIHSQLGEALNLVGQKSTEDKKGAREH